MKSSLAIILAVTASVASGANIPTTAAENGSFTTLVDALTAADLVDTLSAVGPFTVFAPTDDAFAALPEALVPCLLLPENKEALTAILTYHVANGKVMSTDLSNGQVIPTLLQGQNVTIDTTDGVKVNNATVVIADVVADNGVIHAIDGVLVPPSIDVEAFLKTCPAEEPAAVDPGTASDDMKDTTDSGAANIPTVAAENGTFTILVSALTAADLVDTLSAEGPFTVFAPTDDAFVALPESLVPCLLLPENKESLTAILTYHVANGKVMSTDLSNGQVIPTLQGESVTIDTTGGVKVNAATVVIADVAASNGVIHAIDGVLVPPSIDVNAFLKTCPTEVASADTAATSGDAKDTTASGADDAKNDTDSGTGDEKDTTESGASVLKSTTLMIAAAIVSAFL